LGQQCKRKEKKRKENVTKIKYERVTEEWPNQHKPKGYIIQPPNNTQKPHFFKKIN